MPHFLSEKKKILYHPDTSEGSHMTATAANLFW